MATSNLSAVVDEVGQARWLDLVESEHAYLMALARLESESSSEKSRLKRESEQESLLEAALGSPPFRYDKTVNSIKQEESDDEAATI